MAATASLPPVAVTIVRRRRRIPRQRDRGRGAADGDDRRDERAAAATLRGLAGAGPRRVAPGSRSPHSRQYSWPAATPSPQRGQARHPSASTAARLVDQRAAAARAEAGADQQRRAAGADRGAAAPQPPRALEQRVDLARARLDRDELGAALDDERLVEVIAAVHLEREAAELAQPVLAEEQERPALAPEVARGGRGRLAGEERHGGQDSRASPATG